MMSSIKTSFGEYLQAEISKRDEHSLRPDSVYVRVTSKSSYPHQDVYIEEDELREILRCVEALKSAR